MLCSITSSTTSLHSSYNPPNKSSSEGQVAILQADTAASIAIDSQLLVIILRQSFSLLRTSVE